LLGTMGVSNGELVPYAAADIWELHRENATVRDALSIQMWYRNDSSVQLTLPGCDSECPLSTFNAIIAPLTINSTEQLDQMCSSASPFIGTYFLPFLLYFVSWL
ncbi:hypothetical protein PENTCL1PPCAC_7687, partial [Pristionchus entomophagus]